MRCDVDELLVEFAAVLTDHGDIGLQFLLQLGGALLLVARGLEFLLALLDRIGRSGLQRRRGLRRRRLRHRGQRGEAAGQQHKAKWNGDGRALAAAGGTSALLNVPR